MTNKRYNTYYPIIIFKPCMSKNTADQTFGYRSYRSRLFVSLLAWIMAYLLLGIVGLLLAMPVTAFMNFDAIDMMKVTLTDEYIHVTRYIPLTRFDCTFWLKDIQEAGVYKKIKAGKHKRFDGSRGNNINSWYQLHIVLKDSREQEIMLLGILSFERKMLKQALAEKGIHLFEVEYRYLKDINL